MEFKISILAGEIKESPNLLLRPVVLYCLRFMGKNVNGIKMESIQMEVKGERIK